MIYIFATNKNVEGVTISQIASKLRGRKVKGQKRKEISLPVATRIFNELAATGRYTVITNSRGVKKLISKDSFKKLNIITNLNEFINLINK